MDCLLPERDGFSAVEEIRRREKIECQTYTPIIAVTAHALADVQQRCASVALDDFVSKPYETEKLLSVIEGWLSEEHIAVQVQDHRLVLSESSD